MKIVRAITMTMLFSMAIAARATEKTAVVGSPAVHRLLQGHKVFLGITDSPTSEISQHFNDDLTADLKAAGYEVVDTPSDSDFILYLAVGDWRTSLTLVDSKEHVIFWTFSAILTGFHTGTEFTRWNGNEGKAAKTLVDSLKEAATH